MAVWIHRPEWFTKEKYLELKSQRVSDIDIYTEMLFVSLMTFTRFKRELGVYGVGNRGGHTRKIDYAKARELYAKGYSVRAIANRFNVTYMRAYKVVKVNL